MARPENVRILRTDGSVVACELAHGEAIQSIHSFMQLGLAALDDSIHVSDQPVAPSTGFTASILAPLACAKFTMTCQVVPASTSPFSSELCCTV